MRHGVIHTRTHTHTQTRTHTDIQTHTHIHTDTHTHTHRHTHMHIPTYSTFRCIICDIRHQIVILKTCHSQFGCCQIIFIYIFDSLYYFFRCQEHETTGCFFIVETGSPSSIGILSSNVYGGRPHPLGALASRHAVLGRNKTIFL